MKALLAFLMLALLAAPVPAASDSAVVISAPDDDDGLGPDVDRHVGYYYPDVTSSEEVIGRAKTVAEANRNIRVAFITGVELELVKAGHPVPFAIFAKGSDAQKLIVVGLHDGPFDTLYRARASLTFLTAAARQMPVLKQNKVEDWFTFYDVAVLLGFKQITISDGKSWAHQVLLTAPP